MIFSCLIISLLAVLSIALKKLTISAGMAGGILAFALYFSFGIVGLFELAAFFLSGTLVTNMKLKKKNQLNIAEGNAGVRSLGQVIANGGAAFILALPGLFFPGNFHIFSIMAAGSFSAATADTVSSELGNIYGSKFYCILNLKKSTRGLNGVISPEGTFFGLIGSCLIGGIHSISSLQYLDFFIIVIAGTIGNLVDTLLGATLESSHVLNNNQVNFANTVAGAVTAGLLYSIY